MVVEKEVNLMAQGGAEFRLNANCLLSIAGVKWRCFDWFDIWWPDDPEWPKVEIEEVKPFVSFLRDLTNNGADFPAGTYRYFKLEDIKNYMKSGDGAFGGVPHQFGLDEIDMYVLFGAKSVQRSDPVLFGALVNAFRDYRTGTLEAVAAGASPAQASAEVTSILEDIAKTRTQAMALNAEQAAQAELEAARAREKSFTGNQAGLLAGAAILGVLWWRRRNA